MSRSKKNDSAGLKKERFPEAFLRIAQKYYDPIVPELLSQADDQSRPLMVALNGCQGSGKTTLGAYLAEKLRQQGANVLSISLDDFYLPRARRVQLGQQVHPLLSTRGVPGTHDNALLAHTLTELRKGSSGIVVPRFDKARDDCVPESAWEIQSRPADVVIMEGWCWGTRAVADDALEAPVNELEAAEDPGSIWRLYVNHNLKEAFEPLYPLMDYWLMLKAPGFDCVYRWRLEQEEKLRLSVANIAGNQGEVAGVMSASEVKRFIMFYQRLTERVLAELPAEADLVWCLNAHRQVANVLTQNNLAHLSAQFPETGTNESDTTDEQ